MLRQINQLIEEILKFNSTMRLDVLLHKVMSSATKIMQAEASSIMLLNDNNELIFEISLGEKNSFLSEVRVKAGEGIAGWVALHGKPLLVPDVDKDSRFLKKVDEITGFKTKSIICVPLKVEDKVIGVVEVLNPADGRTFSEEDVIFFSIFANLAAVSIQNSKIYNHLQDLFLKEAKNQINRLDVMSHISGITLNPMDFNNLLKAMLEIVIQAVNIEAGIIFLLSEDELVPVVFRGFYEGSLLKKPELKISDQIVKEVIQSQKILKVEGFINNSINYGDDINTEEPRVIIGIPIKTQERIVGVLVVFSRPGKDISQQDIDFLKNFCSHAALSLDKIDANILSGKVKHTPRSVSFDVTTKEEVYKLQLESLMEAINAGVIIFDLNFNIQSLNKKVETIVGISKDDMIGKSCIDCHSSSIHEAVKEVRNKFSQDPYLKEEIFIKNFRSENKTVKASILPVRDAFGNLKSFFMLMTELPVQIEPLSSKKVGKKKRNKNNI